MGRYYSLTVSMFLHFFFAIHFEKNKADTEWLLGNRQRIEIKIVHDLFRFRNEHKADSAELLYADTVQVYMRYFRNIPRSQITKSDKAFWKAHPKNKFEMTEPVQILDKDGIIKAIIIGKEYLDGKSFKYEKIEIRFNQHKKIIYFRAINWKPV